MAVIFKCRFLFGLYFCWLLLLSCNEKVIIFPENDEVKDHSILIDHFRLGGQNFILAQNNELDFHATFECYLEDGTPLNFSPIPAQLPSLLTDQFNNTWDIFGNAIKGPNTGEKLNAVNASLGYWFAWSSIYPRITFEEEEGTGIVVHGDSIDWLISEDFVNRGAIHDAIPALDFPPFIHFTLKNEIDKGSYLKDDDQIIAVKMGEETRIYPIKILRYHEIINDEIDGIPLVVSHHPYTNTTKVWKRKFGGADLVFGVSGLVYNNNMLMFDRQTKSYWSQLLDLCVSGAMKFSKPDNISYIQTTWKTWKTIDRNYTVVDSELGFGFDYNIDPLFDYANDPEYLPFDISNIDSRLPLKSTIFGLANNTEAIAFELSEF